MEKTRIVLLHAGGTTSFKPAEVAGYGTIENLLASNILSGLPGREESLRMLWDTAAELTEKKTEADDE